ncbi:unnamed protein product [Linum trigynum]|uniref:Uncharacterized protein n=1 Tax=Linum trigynum TaxID=586398 RepID=A0AAV2FVQ7_9ROSI
MENCTSTGVPKWSQFSPLKIDLWDIVQEGYGDPQDEDEDSKKRAGKQIKEYKENDKQNASALRIIQQAVSKSIYPRIYGMSCVNNFKVLKSRSPSGDKVYGASSTT